MSLISVANLAASPHRRLATPELEVPAMPGPRGHLRPGEGTACPPQAPCSPHFRPQTLHGVEDEVEMLACLRSSSSTTHEWLWGGMHWVD